MYDLCDLCFNYVFLNCLNQSLSLYLHIHISATYPQYSHVFPKIEAADRSRISGLHRLGIDSGVHSGVGRCEKAFGVFAVVSGAVDFDGGDRYHQGILLARSLAMACFRLVQVRSHTEFDRFCKKRGFQLLCTAHAIGK